MSLWLILLSADSLAAQSTDQNFPSPVTTNEISGTIKVRDIGDSRVTSYFYTFDGGQGDIFINAVTRNFSGDIDIFAADDMRPLTKMVIYADSGSQETGRLIYLRRGERMILRVEGRPPNDDPASFRIKFGGSFIALAPEKTIAEPTVATAEPNESGVRVNSVGTIVAVIPKPTPTPVAKPTPKPPAVAKAKPKLEPPTSAGGQVAKRKTKPAAKPTPKPKAKATPPANGGDKPVKSEPDTVFENDAAKVTVEQPKSPKSETPASAGGQSAEPADPAKAEDPNPDPANPLASIWLVIELKDGNTIRRPMSEVTKFNVEKGVLMVTARNGKIVRYRILEVAKVTIE